MGKIDYPVIPIPVSMVFGDGFFTLTSSTQILVESRNTEIFLVGQYLSEQLAPAMGYELVVVESAGAINSGRITLTILGDDPSLGDEGYILSITKHQVALSANKIAGIFYGIQTIRQLLPAPIEKTTIQPGPWELPVVEIQDFPRYSWRGSMLDVSRHFFGVDDVKRYIDLMVFYKLNILHLHLTDDQGWRLMINSWPKLALHGGSTEVGGGPGGYFSQDEYLEIVDYAQSRCITIIPEIDLPGHTNAALASYAELNCDGETKPLYTGMDVGFSSLCIDKAITYKFLDDVIRELATLTPGPYIHIGGDEAHTTSDQDYQEFMNCIQSIVQKYGKRVIGWDEIVKVDLLPTSIVQFWRHNQPLTGLKPGTKLIISPASRLYLDMKYDESTELGLTWAGRVSVKDAYDWDPTTIQGSVPEENILGIEAPLWTETIERIQDIEFMAFPRLAGAAEIGWSPQSMRDWETYRDRLASHGPRLSALGVNFFLSPLVPWQWE